MDDNQRQRLFDLLVDPSETLDVEIKNWLNVQNKSSRADVAKELIALANHGGGYLIFGFAEMEKGVFIVDENRPQSLTAYSSDALNGIVARYAEPEFHCEVSFVRHPVVGAEFPIVIVPGGHSIPIRAKRDGPNNEVKQNVYYIRRPGAKSEPPQSGREWDELMLRCLQRRQESMLDAIRTILSGQVQQATTPTDQERLDLWTRASLERWREVIAPLPDSSPARFPNGFYSVSYMLLGDVEPIPLAKLLETLDASVARYSGWPPFWVPTRQEIAPYPYRDDVECWIRPEVSYFQGSDHSDFWRASPKGMMFLIRGFQEDSEKIAGAKPKELFDVALPIYRSGECLLHAAKLAANFGLEGGAVLFNIHYEGLAGRRLVSVTGQRAMYASRVIRQDTYQKTVSVGVEQIKNNLAEVIMELLSDLYAQFEFFELTKNLVQDVVNEMKRFAGE